ncbi:MAG: STAS domain-containing protein [Candidatus Omnitrophica bacterium]|nr:STAS domain-containing protein [Candidatus Omnitrophota bacterium]MBU1996486.1 STAS domain-containing protein [Candidatus Omnitrophota bacterium]MBU4333404.1 STAS domain-containing protein [Candidatus Omnitrophota bacterium]
MLKPKIFTTLKNYSFQQFQADFTSGIIVGIVALPLAIAFAVASGVSPDKGIITAVIAGFLISALGGSRVQIGGPTGAFVVIVYSIIQKYGIDGLMVSTFMAGVMLIIMGLAGFGAVIKFIPYPVTVGFTSGIAVIIFISQIKDFLGLHIGALPADFFEKCVMYKENIYSTNYHALAIACLTVFIVLSWGKISKKIPGSIIALIVTTGLVFWLKLPVETIGARFGDIPQGLPYPMLPKIQWHMLSELVQPAFTIAILAAIESLLSAVVADGMIGGRHRSNMELIAQGVANMVSPLFGGIPATGAIARTAVNVHNGGRTPVAGIVHALTLLLIMLFLGKWAKLIPMATLAGILVIVAYRMSEWQSFKMILKAPKSDVLVLLVTFALTVVLDLSVAIQVGMVLAAFLFMRRLALTSNINMITGEFVDEEERDDVNALSKRIVPVGVEIFEINGPFFFGVVNTFVETMNNIEKKPKVRILRMRHVLSIDATAMNALRTVYEKSKRNGIVLILSGVRAQPLFSLEKSGLYSLIGEDNVVSNIDVALSRARDII